MAMSRTTASALLRTRIAAGRPVTGFPPASAASVAPLLRNHQQVRLQHDGDLGGPGGQEPPPQRPAGADTIKRNWAQIGAAAVAIIAIFAYSSSGGKPKKSDVRAKTDESIDVAKKRAQDLKDKSEEGLKQLENKTGEGVAELSGRKSKLAGFRAE